MPIRTQTLWCAATLAITAALLASPLSAQAAPPPPGSNQLIDVSATPGVASTNNEAHFASDVSADGRYVVFSSTSADLVAPRPATFGDLTQIYLRDTVTNTTTVVSSHAGVIGNGQSLRPRISDDGSQVVYLSDSTNIAAGTTGGHAQALLWSSHTGTTVLASAGWESATESIDDSVTAVDISGSGNAVVFETAATDVLPGDPYVVPRPRLYKRPATGETTLVAYDPVLSATAPSVSDDGRYVAFRSKDDHTLVSGSGLDQVYVRDTLFGVTELISADAGVSRAGNADTWHHSISGNGRYVAFDTDSTNLLPAPSSGHLVFVRDRATRDVIIGSRGSGGAPVEAGNATLSANGMAVAYSSGRDVHVRSLAHGATGLVSVSRVGDGGNDSSTHAVISADGRFVAFTSLATNLTPDRYPTGTLFGTSWHTLLRNVGPSFATLG